MVSKDALHRLIDELPEGEVATAEHLLAQLVRGDPMLRVLSGAAEDDEPNDAAEDDGAEEAWREYLDGKVLSADEARRRLLP